VDPHLAKIRNERMLGCQSRGSWYATFAGICRRREGYQVLVKVCSDGCIKEEEEVTAKQQNRTFVFYCKSQLEPLSIFCLTPAKKENNVKLETLSA
jgi:hypothetical protein